MDFEKSITSSQVKRKPTNLFEGEHIPKFIIVILLPLFLLGHFEILDYFIMLFYMVLVIIFPIEKSITIYIALFPWERMFSLPVLSLHSVLQILLIVRIIIRSIKGERITYNKIDLLLISYLLVYGLCSIVFHRNFSGLGLVFSTIVIAYIFSNILGTNFKKYWQSIFKVTILSLLYAILYGVIFQRVGVRWVDGIGSVALFRGVLESNETAFYLNIGLLFLFASKIELKAKVIISIIFYYFLLMTVSLTGIATACIILFYSYVVDIFSVSNKRKSTLSKLIFGVLILSVFGIFLGLDIAEPIISRIQNVLGNIASQDYDSAFSDRSYLSRVYLDNFSSLDLKNRLFGMLVVARDYLVLTSEPVQYSHNSFIDLLFYVGIFGEVIIFAYLFYKMLIYKHYKYYKVFLGLKIIVLISGFTISMLGYDFFVFWLLI
jgi:hypothetical protein